MSDPINPIHYQKGINTIDAILSQMTEEENIGYLRGSALKYLCRFGTKNGQTLDKAVEDLQKSKWFQEKLINYLTMLKEQGKTFQAYTSSNVKPFKKKKW